MLSKISGPYLTIAVFCHDADLDPGQDLLNIQGIVGQVILPKLPGYPNNSAHVGIRIATVVGFAALADGMDYTMRLSLITPRRGERSLGSYAVPAERTGGRHNTIIDLQLNLGGAGQYWMGVYLNERLMTHVPLEVIYGAPEASWPDILYLK